MNEYDDRELKRRMDGLPRTIEPPEDLWPGVRARLAPRRPAEGTTAPAALAPWRPAPWRRPGLRIAALLSLLAVSTGALLLSRHGAGTWRLAMGAAALRPFAAGDSLATGTDTAWARVGRIGRVAFEPHTRARLLVATWSEHRLALERGTLHAEITAPPRLFIVETPSGTAVDLGCAYTLEVDSSGTSVIHVTAGWVSFENGGHASLIPAGMSAVMRRGADLGTPWMDDAPDSLRQALAAFDAGETGRPTVARILAIARERDAVTLWHLVRRTDGLARVRIANRLMELVPPSDDVPRDAIRLGDPIAMDLYWQQLPGTLPVMPAWKAWLWKRLIRAL